MVQLVQLEQHPLEKVDTSRLIPLKVVMKRHVFPASLAELAQSFFAAPAVSPAVEGVRSEVHLHPRQGPKSRNCSTKTRRALSTQRSVPKALVHGFRDVVMPADSSQVPVPATMPSVPCSTRVRSHTTRLNASPVENTNRNKTNTCPLADPAQATET